MPPRPKYSRDEIIDAAYEIMEEKGIDAVVAREVGKKLGTTTGPIFTFFNGMDELKEEVYQKGLRGVCEYLEDSIEYTPAFKEFGLRWIKYAKEHPNVYSMVFLMEGSQREVAGVFNKDFISMIEPIKADVSKTFDVSLEQAQSIVNKMAVFAQGIATLCITANVDIPESVISHDFSEIALSLVAGIRIREGKLDEADMKSRLEDPDIKPTKR